MGYPQKKVTDRHDKRNIPTIDFAFSISRALGVTLDELCLDPAKRNVSDEKKTNIAFYLSRIEDETDLDILSYVVSKLALKASETKKK